MLKDKVILITGGAGLLGREFVKAVIENGGTAIVGDIDEGKGNDFVSGLKSPNAHFLKLDINSKESISSVLKSIKSKYRRLDAVVNNAYPRNSHYGRGFFEVEYKDFCENVNLNLGGYFLMSQQAAELFKLQGGGNIVNIASVYGVISPRFEVYDNTEMTMPVEYAVIKSGLIHLTKYMSKFFKGSNIRVNALSPGGVLNNQPQKFLEAYKKHTLKKGMLEATDLKGTLVFLLSEQSQFINGQNIVVDDGFTL